MMDLIERALTRLKETQGTEAAEIALRAFLLIVNHRNKPLYLYGMGGDGEPMVKPAAAIKKEPTGDSLQDIFNDDEEMDEETRDLNQAMRNILADKDCKPTTGISSIPARVGHFRKRGRAETTSSESPEVNSHRKRRRKSLETSSEESAVTKSIYGDSIIQSMPPSCSSSLSIFLGDVLSKGGA